MNLVECPLDNNMLTISMNRREAEQLISFIQSFPKPIENSTILFFIEKFEVFIERGSQEEEESAGPTFAAVNPAPEPRDEIRFTPPRTDTLRMPEDSPTWR